MQTLLNFSVNLAGKTAKPDQFIDNSFIAELDKSRASSKNYKTLMMEHWNGGVLG
jgi:hypothetical protein